MDGGDYAEGMTKTPIVIDNVRLNSQLNLWELIF